ncbi:hypothetical protein GCM10027341_03210 [Spirosoma knui]
MIINLPERVLVLLIGVSSSGKSTFAGLHFKPTEIVSSDHYRAVIADDENDQRATRDAFELVHLIVEKRLKRGLLTVVDATNLKAIDRSDYLNMARRYGLPAVALVFDLPESVLVDRHRWRADRDFDESVILHQLTNLQHTQEHLLDEGFLAVHTLDSPEVINSVVMKRITQSDTHQKETGPFDIIGDVHGCYDELTELLLKLGYDSTEFTHSASRKPVFVGDLVDRGPNSVAVLTLVMRLVKEGKALCVSGNHDDKLRRYLRGNRVSLTNGLAETVAQVEEQPRAVRDQIRSFLESLPYYVRLDGGRLLVAHAGLREDLHGRSGEVVRAFCLFGATNGQTDAFGLPVRLNWAAEYTGKTVIVYGHTPIANPVWLNNTIDIDTGCAFGGRLTALRYPERELISVSAKQQYAIPSRPFLPV